MPVPPTVATEVLPLLQVPPAAVSLKAIVDPTHTTVVPEIGPAWGRGFTVTTSVATAVPQLLVTEYDITALPLLTPPTTPEEFTVATDVLPLVHTPPVTTSVNTVVPAGHKAAVPEIVPAFGSGFTVTIAEVTAVPQTFVTEYVMRAVPAATPETVPPLTVATPELLLLHVPPETLSVKVIARPAHNDPAPDIVPAAGRGLMVTGAVATAVPQPFVTEYVIEAYPADTPLTIPPLTEATDELLELHNPPEDASVNVIVEPIHAEEPPTIAPATGRGFTVTILVASALPQPFVTV